MSQRVATANLGHSGSGIVLSLLLGLLLCISTSSAKAQSETDQDFAAKVQLLTQAMNQAQRQIEQSQQDLEQLRSQLAALQKQVAQKQSPPAESEPSAELSAAVDQIREQQSLEEAQIATHEQSKVESESKYPLKLSGLVLLTGFVNTTQVDDPVSPTIVLGGSGTTGASLRQTVLGLDATGPHLFNARTRADARVDFYGTGLSNSSATNAYSGGLVRLRTAHASLQWEHTQAFFSLDHAIVAPNAPTSLTAVAVPALAWSGNLWMWNPQVGLTQDLSIRGSQRFQIQAALIDEITTPQVYSDSTISTPSTAEMSRWPGAEGRLAILDGTDDSGLKLGVGGLFAPHLSPGGVRFNSWAGTVDYRIPLPGHLEFSGSSYLGQALGGLGGGTYKDYVYTDNSFLSLHDFGGWAQMKERASEHLEFNAAFGTDQVPASSLRPYAGTATEYYLNLARNRTYTGNVIYLPSAYLMFSLEYRHIQSSPVNEHTSTGNIIGIGTGYRF